jgi:hypothetical protein
MWQREWSWWSQGVAGESNGFDSRSGGASVTSCWTRRCRRCCRDCRSSRPCRFGRSSRGGASGTTGLVVVEHDAWPCGLREPAGARLPDARGPRHRGREESLPHARREPLRHATGPSLDDLGQIAARNPAEPHTKLPDPMARQRHDLSHSNWQNPTSPLPTQLTANTMASLPVPSVLSHPR